MFELLTLREVGTTTTIPIEIISRIPIEYREGPSEGLSRILAKQTGSDISQEGSILKLIGKHPISLWDRRYAGAPPALQYADYWLRYRDAGLPVVNRLFIASDHEIIMPDLTADGSGLYDKLAIERLPSFSPQPTDALFISLDPQDIQEAALKVALSASSHKIELPSDDPLSLLVRPSARFEPHVIDLGYSKFDLDGTEKRNIANVKLFMLWMRKIQNHLCSTK